MGNILGGVLGFTIIGMAVLSALVLAVGSLIGAAVTN
jgi:hypothetical protein